ncbi:TlpA disulfide reductase family protein [Catalinimonas sp. 4WD22]|uniref:TlpA family protein disulfide reductase n=1 Tax=Catalinimonas locisalis TaxID=3133978 RepID=UPI0031019D4D
MINIIKHKWVVILGVTTILYFSGWHKEVIGKLQQGVLATGLIKPEVQERNTSEIEFLSGDMILESASGERTALSQLQGKVLFINFWATWCPPCIAEMPGINKLFEHTDTDEVAFLMISRDEDFSKAIAFVQRKGFDFPIYRLKSPLPSVLQSRVLPTTYIIKKDGEIVVAHQGMADYNNEKMKELLKQLSNEQS